MNTPLDTDLPAGSAEVVARVRAALDEVAATTSSTATAGVGTGSGARMPSRWSTVQWVAAAACLLAVVIGGVLVLRPNDREPLRPEATDPAPTIPVPTDSPMPYFLAAADFASYNLLERPLAQWVKPGEVVMAWARGGDPSQGLLVLGVGAGGKPLTTQMPTMIDCAMCNKPWSIASFGLTESDRDDLVASIVPGSGLPWVLPVDGWELFAYTTGEDPLSSLFEEQYARGDDGDAVIRMLHPFEALTTFTLADEPIEPITVAGQAGWKLGNTGAIWREPLTGGWVLFNAVDTADRVDGLIAAIVPTSGGEPATSVPAPVDNQLVRVVSVSGDALPVFDSSGASDPAVGLPIPTIQTSAGKFTVDGPTLFVFVAHWCPHCNAELPRLIEGLASNAFDGARVVLVSTAESPSAVNYPPGEWLASRGWTGEVLYDASLGDGAAGELAEAFGASAWPYFVMVNSEGVVTARAAGEREVDDVVELINTAATGDVVGQLVIDAIDLDFMVLEGGGDHVATLKKGPILTFDRETGTPTIVGHRTTYGAPFLRLEELQIGDRLTFTTVDGTRTFEVTLVDRCDGDEPCPARDGDDLLLAAFDPEYTSNTRLTVHATEVFD
ncbi:MAG TPA: hypothetical protein DCR14_00795 [Acidimicrobiaceae bacterium]|nr:hypothetical protein [Acidimicrobiaceae bacterium]